MSRDVADHRVRVAAFGVEIGVGVVFRDAPQAKVMRSQLYHLAEVAEHPKTSIQVIRSGGAHAGLLAHFVIADLA